MVKTRPFDAAEVLDSPEMIAAWLTEAFGSDDPAVMARAIGNDDSSISTGLGSAAFVSTAPVTMPKRPVCGWMCGAYVAVTT